MKAECNEKRSQCRRGRREKSQNGRCGEINKIKILKN